MDIGTALYEIHTEYDKAAKKFPKFNSNHEGYAVILEEMDELWDEIKKSDPQFASMDCRKEAIQVGAMALRFLVDRC